MLYTKKILFTLLIGATISTTWGCFGTLTPDPDDNACFDSEMRSIYENDAIRLAILWQQSSTFANAIDIPEGSIDRIGAALAAVHNSKSPQRDSIITRYQIHTLPYPKFYELTVEIDTAVAWTQAWKNGQRLTNNANINALMNAYNLQLDGYFSLSTNFVILKSPKPLNIAALAAAFADIAGVMSTDFENSGGDGNNIGITDDGTEIVLEYSVGYDEVAAPNNCNGNCEFIRTWVFIATFPDNNIDCPNAQFSHSYGAPAP